VLRRLAFGAEAKPCAVRTGQCFGCTFAARFRATIFLIARRRVRTVGCIRAVGRVRCRARVCCRTRFRTANGARGRAFDRSRVRACGPHSASRPGPGAGGRTDPQRTAHRECGSSRTTPQRLRCAGRQRFRSSELCFRRSAPG
jgi:hypothetical protein